MASSRSTPIFRESPAASRAEDEVAASSSATKDEIARSDAGGDKSTENGGVLF